MILAMLGFFTLGFGVLPPDGCIVRMLRRGFWGMVLPGALFWEWPLSCLNRYRGFDVAGAFGVLLQSLPRFDIAHAFGLFSFCNRYRGFDVAYALDLSSFCIRYRKFDVAYAFGLLLLQSLPRVYLGIIFFIFFDPCAGRHLLSLLRQRK
jgi:hypothetical protein